MCASFCCLFLSDLLILIVNVSFHKFIHKPFYLIFFLMQNLGVCSKLGDGIKNGSELLCMKYPSFGLTIPFSIVTTSWARSPGYTVTDDFFIRRDLHLMQMAVFKLRK